MTQAPLFGEYVTEPELPTRALTLWQPKSGEPVKFKCDGHRCEYIARWAW